MESAIQNKMKLLFSKISEPNYVLDSYYGDSLINKLSNNSDPELDFFEKTPFFSGLLIDALENYGGYHITVKVFLIRLVAIVSKNELHFGRTAHYKSQLLADGFTEIISSTMNSSLKVAFMEVALAIVQHDSGVKWILQYNVWKNIVNLCKERQTIFVVRQTYKFTSEFSWKLNDLNDEASIMQVLDIVLAPITNQRYFDMKTMSSEEEQEHIAQIQPVLHMLLALFNKTEKVCQKTCLMPILINHYKIMNHLYVILECLRNEEILHLLSKLLFWHSVAKIFIAKPYSKDVEYVESDYLETRVLYFNIIHSFLQRRTITIILDFSNTCNIIWHQIWQENGPTLQKKDGMKVEIQFLLIFIPVLPIFNYFKTRTYGGMPSKELTNETLQEYVRKLVYTPCEHTTRTLYAMRDVLKELDSVTIALQSVKRLSCLQNHINNDQANLIFQTLFYVLTVYDPIDQAGNPKPLEHYEDTQETVMIMTYVMDTVLVLVKNFHINWPESLEVLCLYTIVWNILKKPNLSVKFIVTALNVLTIAIKKFLPPNLSLLLELKPGTSVNEIGKLIYTKMHDMHWEIRDSALELLLVVTDLSFIKFPSFQKQILENNLIDVAATIATHDTEYYVQASALKCLGAATKVNALWDQLLERQPDVPEKLIRLLRYSQEGIVRNDAANVLCDMYKNVKLPPACIVYLYKHMVSSALSDFHWEVQLAALRFFKYLIRNSLNEQGMLDGTFPPVTFSKESRKIVTLNEAEIQRRLIKCLEKLSAMGCLTVFVMLLEEETELEIMEAALTIATELMDILIKYKVPENMHLIDSMDVIKETLTRIKKEAEEVVTEEPTASDEKTEEVIEGILNSTDINLLATMYENQMKLEGDSSEKPALMEPKIRLERYITPSMFVTYMTSRDFKACIEQKKQWKDGIRSISSLLDDILGIYDANNEVNSMDCY